MSPSDCRLFHVLWITLQMLVVLAGPYLVVAMAHFTPYVSEFTYDPDYHPSRNPKCPWRHEADNEKGDPGENRSWNHRRSPEEGLPVGQEPSIEIRAVLVRCPRSHEETIELPMRGNGYNITAGRSQDILEFHGFDRDEPARHSEVRNCRRKLIVTMKFNNIGKTKTQEEFVVIDHVLDPVTMHKARLLNPFVVKVRQEPVLQLYGLKFQSVVNGEAKEEVINKKLANYTGCDNGLKNPTCGQMLFHGDPIPYSQGFCCSCDPEVNAERQPSLKLNHPTEKSFSSMKPPCNNMRSNSHDNINVRSVFDDVFEDEESLRGSEEMTFDKKPSELIRKAKHKEGDHEEKRLQENLSSAESISKDADRYISKFVGSQSRESRTQKDNVDKIYGVSKSVKNKSTPILEKDRIKFKGEIGPTLSVQSFSKDFQDPLRDDKGLGDKFSSEYSDEVMSPILQSALIGNMETKGKIEPYIDAVSRQALRERSVYSKWGDIKKSIDPDGTESKDVDRDIIGEFKKSDKDSFLNHRPITEEAMYKKPLIRSKNVNVTSELLELEGEYEAFKKMNRRRAGPGDGGGRYGQRSISEPDAKSLAEVTSDVQGYTIAKKQPFVKEQFVKVTKYEGPTSDSNGGKFENIYSALSRPETVDTHGQFDVFPSKQKMPGVSFGLRSNEMSDRTVSKDSGRIPLGSLALWNSQGQQDASSSSLSISSEIPSTRIKVLVPGRNSYRAGSYAGGATTQPYSWSMESSAKSDEIESGTRRSEITIDVPAKATTRAPGSFGVQGAKLNSSNSTAKPSSTFLMQSTTKENANLGTPLILRQELVNDTLYPVSVNNVTEMNGTDNFRKNNKFNGESDKKLHDDMTDLLERIIESDDEIKKFNDSKSSYKSSNNTDYKDGRSDENINSSSLGDRDESIENILRIALSDGESLEQDSNEGTVLRKLNDESNDSKEYVGGKFEFIESVNPANTELSKIVTSRTERIENEESVAPRSVSKVTWKDQRVIKDPLLGRLNYSSLITAGTNRHFQESNQKGSSNSSTQELSECSEKTLAKSSRTLKNISRDVTHDESPTRVTRNFQDFSKQLASFDQTDPRPRRMLEPFKPEVEFIDQITEIENPEQSALGRLVYSGTTSGLVSGSTETVRLRVEAHSKDPTVEKLSCKEKRDKTKVNSRGVNERERYRDTLVATNLESYVDLGTPEDWPKRPRKRSLWSEKAKRHVSRSYADDLRDPDVESIAIDKGYFVPGKTNDRISEEPVTVLSGGFDLIKGNLHYEDQSATVINEHHLEAPAMFTEQDYIFLDENGRERAANEARLEEQRDGLREQVLRKYLKGSAEKMKTKDDRKNKQKSLRDADPYENFENNFHEIRRDDVHQKRDFRSINYEDTLDVEENECEMKIDKKIDARYVEISKALKEATNDVKLTNRDERKKISKNDHSLLRNFAVALNRIPRINNFQRSNEPAKLHSSVRKVDPDQRDEVIFYPSDGYRTDQVPFTEKPQKKTKPFFTHANPNQANTSSIVNPNAGIADSTTAQLPVPKSSSTKTRTYETPIRSSVTLNVNPTKPTISQIPKRPELYSKEASQMIDNTFFTSPALEVRTTVDIPDASRKHNDRHNLRVTESSIFFMNMKNINANGMGASRNVTMEDTSKIDHKKYGTFDNKKWSFATIPQSVDIHQQEDTLPLNEKISKQSVTSELVAKSELGNESTLRNVTRTLPTAEPGQDDTILYIVPVKSLDTVLSYPSDKCHKKIFPVTNEDGLVYREIDTDPKIASESNSEERQLEMGDDKIVIERTLFDIKPERTKMDDDEFRERETASGFNGSFSKKDQPGFEYVDTVKPKMALESVNPSNFVHKGRKVPDPDVENKLTDTVSQRRKDMKEGLTWSRVAKSGFLDPGMKTSSTYPGNQLGSSITKEILYSTSPEIPTLTTRRMTIPGVFIATGITFPKDFSPRIPLHIQSEAPWKRSFSRSESYNSVDIYNRRTEPNSVDSKNPKLSIGSFTGNITIFTVSGNTEDPNVYSRMYKFSQAVREGLVEKLKSREVLQKYLNPKKNPSDPIVDVNSPEGEDDSDLVVLKNYKKLKRSINSQVPVFNIDDNNNIAKNNKDKSCQMTAGCRSISHTSYLRLPAIGITSEKGRVISEDLKLKENLQRSTAIIKPVTDVQESFDASRLKMYDDFANSTMTDIPVKKNAKILSTISTTFTSNIFNGMDRLVVSAEEHPAFLRDETDSDPAIFDKTTQNVWSLDIKRRKFLQAFQIPRKSFKRRTHPRRGVNSWKKDNDRKKKPALHSRVYRDAEHSLSRNDDLNARGNAFGNLVGLHARNRRLCLERSRKRFLLPGRKGLDNETRNDPLRFYDYDYYPREVDTLYKKKLEESRIAERKSGSMGKTIVTTDDGVSNLVGTEADYKLDLEKDEWKNVEKRTENRNENDENLREKFKSSRTTIGTTDDGISNLVGTETGEIIRFDREGNEALRSDKRNVRKTRGDDEIINMNFDNSEEFSKNIFNDVNRNFVRSAKSLGNKGRKIVKRCGDSCHPKFTKHINNERWKAKMELLKLKKHADTLKEYLNWSHDVVTPEYLLPTDITSNEEKISGNDKDTVIRNGSDSLNNTKSSGGIIINFEIPSANFSSRIGIDVSNTLTTIPIDVMKNKKSFENHNYGNATAELNLFEKSFSHFLPQDAETTSKRFEETKTVAFGYDDECSTGKILPACETGNEEYEDRYELPEEAMISKNKDGGTKEGRYSFAKKYVGVQNGSKKVESLEKLVTLGVATHQTNRVESPISEKLDSASLKLKNEKNQKHGRFDENSRFLVKTEDATVSRDHDNSLIYGDKDGYNSSGITSLPFLLEILYSQDTTRNSATELFLGKTSFNVIESNKDKNNVNNNYSSGSSILPENKKFFIPTKNRYVDANVGGSRARGLADDKEGIILPDVDTLDIQEKRRFMNSMENYKTPSSELENIKRENGSIRNSNDIDNDAVIISLIEKDRTRDENIIKQDKKLPETYEIYEKEIPYEGSESLKNNQNQIPDPLYDREEMRNFKRNGRRILAIDKSKYSKDTTDQDYAQWNEKREVVDEDDQIADDEDAGPSVSHVNSGYVNSHDKRTEREKMKENWDVLVNKIINKNPNFKKPKAYDSINNNDNDTSLKANKSSMERLHFYDADKYINKMARKISHYSNMHNFKDDDDYEKQLKDYKNQRTDKHTKERDASNDEDGDINEIVNGSDRNFREQDVDGYKDDSEVEEEVVLGEDVNDTPVKRRTILREKLEDFPGRKISINSRRVYPFMKVEYEPDSLKSFRRKIAKPSSVSSEDKTIDKKDVKRRNSTGNTRFLVADENDNDFEISLNGKIHINGGTNGQPLSISIDPAPELPNVNAQTTGSGDTLKNQLPDSRFRKVEKSKKKLKNFPKRQDKFFIPLERNSNTRDSELVDRSRESMKSLKGDTKDLGEIFKRGNIVYGKNPSSKRYSKFMKTSMVKDFRNGAKPDTSWSSKVDQDSPSRLLPVSSIVDKSFVPSRGVSRKRRERMKKRTAHRFNVKSTDFINNELDHRDVGQGSNVKIVKIIPVQFPRLTTHNVPGHSPENLSNLGRDQKSRLITSEMPKLEEVTFPVTEKAGKIEPFDVPENEDESDLTVVTDKNDWRYVSDSSDICNTLSNRKPELCNNGFKNYLDENHGSTNHPSVKVKFMGLIGIKKPDLNQTDYQMLDEIPNSCNTNVSRNDESKSFDVVPLIRVKITEKKIDEPLIDKKTVLLQLNLNVTTESNQDNQDSNQYEDNRINSKQMGLPVSCQKCMKTATVKPEVGSVGLISSSASGSTKTNDERNGSDEILKFPKFNNTMVEEIHAGPNQKHWPLSLDEYNDKNWLGKAHESQRENHKKSYGNFDHEKWRFELNHSQPGNSEGDVKSNLRSRLNFTNLESGNRLQDKLDAGDSRSDLKIKVPELCDPKEGNLSPWCTTTLRSDDNTINNVMNNDKKTVQVENMLAIMEFMKKIKNMINGDNQFNENKKNDGSVIQLEKVVLVPENQSQSELNDDVEVQITTDHVITMGEGVKHDEVDGTEKPKFQTMLNHKLDPSENLNNSSREKSSSISNKSTSGTKNVNDKSFLFYRQQHGPSFVRSAKIYNDVSSRRGSKESKIKHQTENLRFFKRTEPKIKKIKGRSSHIDSLSRHSDPDLDPLQAVNMDNDPSEVKSLINQAPKLENFGLFSEDNIKLDGNKDTVPEKLNVLKNSANIQSAIEATNSSNFMTSNPDTEYKIFGNESDVQRISNDSLNRDITENKDADDQDAESYNMRVHEKLKKEMMAKKLSEWQGIGNDLPSTSTSGSDGTEEQIDSKHNPKNLELGKELEEFQRLQEESVKREKELLRVVQKKINERLHDLDDEKLKEKSSQGKTDLTNLEPLIPLLLGENNNHDANNDLIDVSNVNNHHSLASLTAGMIRDESEKSTREEDYEKLIDDSTNNDKKLDSLSVPVDYSLTKYDNDDLRDDPKVSVHAIDPDEFQTSNVDEPLGLNKAREFDSEVTGVEDTKILSNDYRRKDVDEEANNIPNGKREVNRQIYITKELPSGKDTGYGKQKYARHSKVKTAADRRRKKKRRHRKKKKHKKKKHSKGGKWWPFKRHLLYVPEDQDFRSVNNYEFTVDTLSETRINIADSADRRRKKLRINKNSIRKKRQIHPGGTQVRGGQDCMDRRHPSDVNPAKYLESAHCLRFSDLWYSVYEMENPIMEHTVYLQLYEKHTLPDGTTHWDDLTQGSMVRLGTFIRHQRDIIPTIVFTYSGAKVAPQKRAHNLNPSRERLLVPSPVAPDKISKYPELKGGSGEYLVVGTNAISKNGNECDKAGVGFTAFAMQPDRCGRVKGTCLKNQPLAYWRHDMEAREAGRPGCYFLSNFASVPIDPIKYNVSGSGSREFLGLEYHSPHVSAIDIEVRADYNAIVRVGSSGRVTEVYIDSTAIEHTIVTVVISNMGLASSPYQPRISDCPTGLPVSWTKAKGTVQVIPPQHDQRVTLDLYGQLYVNGFHCSVEVVNHHGELVAMRRIRVQKMDRCFCVWHCLCACVGSVTGLGCQPMSPEHYHAAGFQGPVPVTSAEPSVIMNTVRDVLIFSALVILLLLILGMLKWLIGIFAPAVGRWGLDNLLEGSKMDEYFEPELKCRCLVTDDDGVPVHPETGQRTVRICNRKAEFFLNLIFFLTYPIAICCNYVKRSFAPTQTDCCPDESKTCLISEKAGCPKLICVNTYGDTRNSKMEAEDTQYVMNELKKSQESLQDPKRPKKTSRSKSLSRKSSHRTEDAESFVDDLLQKRVVFRNLTEPIGGLSVPPGTLYSVRGYFFNSKSGEYSFITPCPFKQHWLIDNCTKRPMKPPKIYPSNLFMRTFNGASDVRESNEISLEPRGICINVQYLDDR